MSSPELKIAVKPPQAWAAPKAWASMIARENIRAEKSFTIRPIQRKNGVAIIDVSGVIMRDADSICEYFGGASTVRISEQVNEVLADNTVNAILLRINSPGGMVNGTAELADVLFQARTQKPLLAYVSGDGYSAAYWLASQAHKVIAHEAAGLGAIGVCVPVSDTYSDWIVSNTSPNKYPELAKAESLAQMQVFIDALGEIFIRAVGRGRGVTEQEVVSRFGGGDIFIAQRAVQAGLCDIIGNLDDALALAETATIESLTVKESIITNSKELEEENMANEKIPGGNRPTAEMVDTNEITQDWIKNNMPDLYEQIRNEAAEGEKERQMALDEVAPVDEEEKEQVALARKDRKVTPEALAFKLRVVAQAKQKAVLDATLAQRKADSEAVKVPVNNIVGAQGSEFDEKVKLAMMKKKGIKT